jgi:hypothetical protein
MALPVIKTQTVDLKTLLFCYGHYGRGIQSAAGKHDRFFDISHNSKLL